MVTAVDTSVLVDVLLDDPQHGQPSAAALRQAAVEGTLVLCEAAEAEITPVLNPGELAEFMADWKPSFSAGSEASACLAGEMFRLHLARGGKRGRVVPDFLIAAHAQVHAGRLLPRDRGCYRDYFSQLVLWYPAAATQPKTE